MVVTFHIVAYTEEIGKFSLTHELAERLLSGEKINIEIGGYDSPNSKTPKNFSHLIVKAKD